jgi:molybdate transport system substrate-binding protein
LSTTKLGLTCALLLVAGLACGDVDGAPSSQEVIVLAAASLTHSFTEMEGVFEEQNPDIDLVMTFDSSTTLAAQVAEGGPAGVLATADENSMATAVDSGEVVGEPEIFTANRGVIAVPADSDVVSTPEDLEGDVTLAVCAPEVPCRIVADQLFEELGIEPEIDSEEENVAAVLTKLAADEVDAGVVYTTDDLASDDVEAIDIGDVVVTALYPIVNVSGDDRAQAFVDFVTGDEGQAILSEAGFTAP